MQVQTKCSFSREALKLPVRLNDTQRIFELKHHDEYMHANLTYSNSTYLDKQLMWWLQKVRSLMGPDLLYQALEKNIRLGIFQLSTNEIVFQYQFNQSTKKYNKQLVIPGSLLKKNSLGLDSAFRDEIKCNLSNFISYQDQEELPRLLIQFKIKLGIRAKAQQLVALKNKLVNEQYALEYICYNQGVQLRNHLFEPLFKIKLDHEYGLPLKLLTSTGYRFFLLGGIVTNNLKPKSYVPAGLLFLNKNTQVMESLLKHKLIDGLLHPAVVTLQQKVYLFGGIYFENWRPSKDIILLNLETKEITVVGQLMHTRMNHAAAFHAGKFLVYGGYELTQNLFSFADSKDIKTDMVTGFNYIESFSPCFKQREEKPFQFPGKHKTSINCFGFIDKTGQDYFLTFYGVDFYSSRFFCIYNLKTHQMRQFHKENYRTFFASQEDKYWVPERKDKKMPIWFIADKQGYYSCNAVEFVQLKGGEFRLISFQMSANSNKAVT